MAKKQEVPSEEKKITYTKYEIARMVGSRALQIAEGAPYLVKLTKEELEKLHYNPIEIAKLEYEKGVLPMTVRRPLPGHHDVNVEAEEAEKKAEEIESEE